MAINNADPATRSAASGSSPSGRSLQLSELLDRDTPDPVTKLLEPDQREATGTPVPVRSTGTSATDIPSVDFPSLNWNEQEADPFDL